MYESDGGSIFINTFKNIVSKIDVCSILNIKENECIEKQKEKIEIIQHIAKSKKLRKVNDREMNNIQKNERS